MYQEMRSSGVIVQQAPLTVSRLLTPVVVRSILCVVGSMT
jgi:hypothetical protein